VILLCPPLPPLLSWASTLGRCPCTACGFSILYCILLLVLLRSWLYSLVVLTGQTSSPELPPFLAHLWHEIRMAGQQQRLLVQLAPKIGEGCTQTPGSYGTYLKSTRQVAEVEATVPSTDPYCLLLAVMKAANTLISTALMKVLLAHVAAYQCQMLHGTTWSIHGLRLGNFCRYPRLPPVPLGGC
jgi:hypothetical protein